MHQNPAPKSETRAWGFVAAGAAAWLIPSFLVAAYYDLVGKEPLSDLLNPGILLLGVIIPLYGLVVGWIPLLGAFIAWAVLHRLRRTGPPAAISVGLLAGMVAPLVASPPVLGRLGDAYALTDFLLITAFTTALGALVGLIVWRIAYGKTPAPRPALS